MENSQMQSQSPSKSCLLEQFMHKNRLQELSQKSKIPLPVYQTLNEGSPHYPKFRATVLVNGVTYRSAQTFIHRKAAEQDVARLALQDVSRKIMDQGCSLIHEDTIFCKSILNEFAVKMNLGMPTYVTSQLKGMLPVFRSSLEFNGRSYTGDSGRNKREAEQLAARTVVLSILGNSDSRTLMSQIITSKRKLHAASQSVDHSGVSHDRNVAYGGNLESSTKNHISVRNDVGIIPGIGNMPQLSVTACPEDLPSGQPAHAQVTQEAQLDFYKQKEVLSELSSGSIRNVAAVTNDPLASGPSGPSNVTAGRVDESQHVHHSGAKNVLSQEGASATSLDSQAIGVSSNIGKKRARDNK